MSTLASVMSTASKSLAASQLELSVASNNIANAQTPGYSRERVNLAASPADGTNPPVGSGVDIVSVQALRDQLINSRLNQETSQKSAADSLQQSLQDIESLFNDTQNTGASSDTGLSAEITNFFNAFQTLSTNPSSPDAREALKTDAQTMSDGFLSRSNHLKENQTLANQAVAADVQQINSLASQIAAVTTQISEAEGATGAPANTLRDQRSQLVQQLSGIVDVKEVESGGNYQLTLGGGTALVLNGDAQSLTVQAAAGTGFYAVHSGQNDITSEIGSGDLKAQIQLRDQYIPGYLNQLDQLAFNITQQVNAIHSLAYNPSGVTGINFFAPLGSSSGAAGAMALSSQVAASASNIAVSQGAGGGDNVEALALGNLLTAPVFGGASVNDQYGKLVFNIGSDSANAQASLTEHTALATQLQTRQQSASGVSIDEETVQILQFQQAYQASAKVLSIVDQLLQTALTMGSGSATA
jgi:flagellar hook-associated protein 1 FlgK